jgi:hypothetical protein
MSGGDVGRSVVTAQSRDGTEAHDGIGLVLEAVRQIRGTSANQVPGADISLLLGGPVAPLVSATVFGSAATL